jgi:elongator complex protein 3
MKKISRTISGVTPVAVMVSPQGCPNACVYCPTYPEAPKSYTPDSPAVLRASKHNFEASSQVAVRILNLADMGHPVDKIELIIMGGTFLAYPEDYQYRFIKDCYDSLNGCVATSLEEAKRTNETSQHRCVGLCIETRPDWCGEKEISHMLDFGTTRVELGIQALDDEIYKLVKRGHKVQAVIDATRLLKEHGLKVHYHWMPGLPGSTREHDLEMSRLLFSDDRFKPDGLKLYPTLVVENTELEKWYREGRYQPYAMDELVDLMIDIKMSVPGYVRISRVMRDIPTKFIVAGSKDLALRGTIRERMKERGLRCRCIRCREHGHRAKQGWKFGEPVLKRMDYESCGGHEVFLTFEDSKESIFGLLRLRINSHVPENGFKAIVREIHVYGSAVPLGGHDDNAVQHKGLGSRLLAEAERIASGEFGATELAVISGVGARDYFRNEMGYSLVRGYMVKTGLSRKMA